jgi:hypothetical protein
LKRGAAVRLAALAIALCAAPSSDAAPGVPPDAGLAPADRTRLLAGEVLVDGVRTDAAGGAARARAVMRGPAEAAWAVVVSCEAAFRFVHGLRECEVLEDTGERARVRQAVRPNWFLPTTEFVYRVERRPWSAMSLHLEAGEVDALEGAWRFDALDEGMILVTHEIRVAPRFPAPRWVVRATIRGDLPDMLACIRGLAGASLDEAMAGRDRARCAPPPAQR